MLTILGRAIRTGYDRKIRSIIAVLGVCGGLSAVGGELPVVVQIGIPVAAALVTGLTAGGITYTVLKPSEGPSNNLDSSTAEPISSQSLSSI